MLGPQGEALATLLDALDRSRYAESPGQPLPDRGWWRQFQAAQRQVRRAG